MLKYDSFIKNLPLLKEKFYLYISEIYFIPDIYRSDLAFAIGLSIFIAIALKITPKNWHALVILYFLIVNAFLLLILGLELAHYLNTGVIVSGSLLLYFFRNIFSNEFWSLILSVTSWSVFVPIFTPLLLGVIIFYFLKFTLKRSELNYLSDYKINANVGHIIWPVFTFISLVPSNLHHDYIRFNDNILTTLGRDIFLPSLIHADRKIEVKASDLETFDTSRLKLNETSKTRPFNVVIIMLESIRAQSTGIYNPSLKTTPFLDELSKKSIIVDSMHAVIPRTSAAWVSVLQGIHPGTDDVLALWAKAQTRLNTTASLPRLMAKVGYRSAFFAPTHLDYENEGVLISNMGFDQVVSEHNYDSKGFEKITYFGLEDQVMLNPILSWVNEQNIHNAKFLLTVMTHVGHISYELPSTWKKMNFPIPNRETTLTI